MTDPAVAAPPPGHAQRGDAPANGDAVAATWGRASLEAALDNALKGNESLQPPQSGAAAPAPGLPTRGDGMLEKRISAAEIQLVQNLVERCLQLYMNQREVITILHQHARVEPDFTALVWEKLEEQNAEFFSAYYTRLRLKEQILAFNTLLEQHAGVIDKMHATGSPIIGLGHHDHGVAHDPSAASQLLLGGGIHHAHAHHGAGLAMAAGEAKLSTSGLLLDRRGAFLSAGDYLMDGPHPPHLGHTPPMATGPGSLVGGHSHHHLDHADGSHLLHNLPRNFSLSDLSLDMAAQMAGDMSLLDDGLGHGAPSQR